MEDRQKIGITLIIVGIPLLYYFIIGVPLIIIGIILLIPHKVPIGAEKKERRKTVLGFGIGVLVTGLIFLICGIWFSVQDGNWGSAVIGIYAAITIGVILVIIGPIIMLVSLRYK